MGILPMLSRPHGQDARVTGKFTDSLPRASGREIEENQTQAIAWARRPCYAEAVDSLAHVILDSSRGAEADFAPWTRPLSAAKLLLHCDARTCVTTLRSTHGILRTWDNPLQALSWMAQPMTAGESGRWVGFLNYDLAGLFELLPARAQDDLHTPLFAFTCHEPAAGNYAGSALAAVTRHHASDARIRANFTRDDYLAAVERVVQYIRDGDVFQVNLSQRFAVGVSQQPIEIYRRLQRESPAVYGGFLDYGDFALLSNSPELFLRVIPQPDGSRQLITRPIKGTRPQRQGADVELRDSLKDQAELNMIVDVERNDLGRICEIGSVKVVEPRTIESHPTVVHGVATVQGTLRPDVGFVDLLRATFPSGSVTGAPKIRSMEIIDELEPSRRGAYCGAIGYLDSTGRIEFNVAIRTMTLKDGVAYVPVGGGIVADSQPAAEYAETLVKAQAMFAALGVSPADPSPGTPGEAR